MDKTQPQNKYRSDIQGLRAVAVLFVIFCHAKLGFLSGGFIGVDVFFVLSGYLITGLLVDELNTSGTVRLASFYARRLQRLAPALLAMLAFSSTLLYVCVAPAQQQVHLNAAASAALWISNFRFAFDNADYFTPEATENLFLHTWSLSVEEQFYLVWPLLLMALVSLARVTRFQFSLVSWPGAILGLLTLASFAACLQLSNTDPVFAYYTPHSRAWQFGVGAITLLASRWLTLRGGALFSNPAFNTLMMHLIGWGGLFTLLLAAVVFDETLAYPGTYALAPTLGTALVLFACSSGGASGCSRLLSVAPLVGLGNISYSLYLWHWPALVFAKLFQPQLSTTVTLGALAIAFILALLSYWLLETPIRRNSYLKSRPRLVLASSVCLIAITVGYHWRVMDVGSNQLLSQTSSVIHARNSLPELYRDECDDFLDSSTLLSCEFGTVTPEHEAYLVGDSIGVQWYAAIAEISKWPGWRLTVLTKSACPMVEEPFYYTRIKGIYTMCDEWREKALARIVSVQPELVFMGSSQNYPFNETQWRKGSSQVLKRIAPAAGAVYVLRSTPSFSFNMLDCAQNEEWMSQRLGLELSLQCSASLQSFSQPLSYDVLRELAADYDNVAVVDLNELACPEEICVSELDQTYVFRDSHHVTDTFVRKNQVKIWETLDPDGQLRAMHSTAEVE